MNEHRPFNIFAAKPATLMQPEPSTYLRQVPFNRNVGLLSFEEIV